MTKKITTITLLILSIILISLLVISTTYSVIIDVIEEDSESTAADESSTNDENDAILDEYGDLFSHEPHCHRHKMMPLAVKETPHHYLVSISKESLKGQSKFLIQFDDKEKG